MCMDSGSMYRVARKNTICLLDLFATYPSSGNFFLRTLSFPRLVLYLLIPNQCALRVQAHEPVYLYPRLHGLLIHGSLKSI